MSRIALPVAMSRQPAARDHISFSSISLYQTCGLRYFFRYVERLPEPTVSASLLVGAGLHAGIEHHFREQLIGNPPPSLNTLLDVFWSAWHERDGQVVARTADELSDRLSRIPGAARRQAEPGWRCVRIAGKMDFSMVRVLLGRGPAEDFP
jgi:PD-(D/E)XK nuclease superfamily